MLDFDAVKAQEITFDQLVADLRREDLQDLTHEMIDTVLDLIKDCVDADVVFQPVDPEAHDSFTDKQDEIGLAWNLGHVIVHITASAEESAALAAEMARGVPNHGRSRSEVPWRIVTTMAQCRRRLEESRRMHLASLDMWPDEPYLDLTYKPYASAPEINAIGRFVLGLRHTHNHLGQITDIVRQAKAAR